ncbi:MAG: sodium:proline symporter [Planctomycetes bacterium]|nr:sodium:proline symporter [Planctomycetota bacterium]
MGLAPLDWAIIVLYLVFAVGVGIFFARRAGSSTEEYFLSGRSLPWWVVGTSMVATTFAADTPLAITEFIRGPGIWQNWFWWNMVLAGLLGVLLFSRLWRRALVLTDNELLELRYHGKPAAFLRAFKAGYFALLYNFIVLGWVINGMSAVMAILLDTDRWTAVWVCVVIALVYALLSGFWGVVITDLVQFVIAMAGSVILAIIAVSYVGGMGAIVECIESAAAERPVLEAQLAQLKAEAPPPGGPDGGKDGGADGAALAGLAPAIIDLQAQLAALPPVTENTLRFLPPLPEEEFLSIAFWETPFSKFLVFLLIMWWSTHSTDGGGYIIQRMSSAKNERHALLGTLWFNLAHYALRIWPWIVVGLVSLVAFPDIAAVIGEEAHAELGEKAGYPLVMAQVLGPGLMGLLVVSFLAAFMSTIDTHLNWGASYLINDVYRRFIKPDSDFDNEEQAQHHYVVVGRYITIGLMGCAAVVAMWMQSIAKAWEFIFALGAGIGLVLILRWFWWRINAWTEIAALATSIGITVAFEILAWSQTLAAGEAYTLFGSSPVVFGVELAVHHKLLIIVPLSITAWVTVTFLTKPEPEATLRTFYARVQPGGWWGRIAAETEQTLEPVSRGFFWSWIAGVAFVWGATFGVGNLVFGRTSIGLTLVAISAAGFAWLWRAQISRLD